MDAPSSPSAKETWTLRPAVPDDIARVLEIERQCYPAPWAEENFCTEFAKPYSHFLVLTDDETDSKIAGYIVFWILFDEGQILNVAVDLPFRGQGFAKLMVRQAVKATTYKGKRKVLLEVRKSNLPAVQLYQSIGFVIIHVRKEFYSNGEDAYQMALYLDEPQTANLTDF